MLWLAALAVVAQVLPFVSASPITTVTIQTDNNAVSRRAVSTQWKVEDLNDEFKGIWWNEALSGKVGECTPAQIDKLVYATRASMWILDAVAKDEEFYNSQAWDRYFKPYAEWLKLGNKYKQLAAKIRCKFVDKFVIKMLTKDIANILQVAKYPRYGDSRKPTQGRRVTYTCNANHLPDGVRRCGTGKV
jgi:hypothetical protein